MVKMMKTVSVILLLYTIHIEASPLNHHLDYLDPILYLEHRQSPNGRYKYGYESLSAIAHQEHGSDGVAKGFYSYVDDQGKVQRVEYVAGHDGYRVLGGGATSVYTPEVEAARKAHMEAYLAAYNRAKEVQSVVENNNAFLLQGSIQETLESAMKAQKEVLLEGQRRAYNQLERINMQLQAERINLNNILPPPIVHHYEKIWPLPPVRYRDLSIEVNGQDRYDPRTQNRNHFGEVVHNTFPAIGTTISPPTTFPAGLYYPKFNTVGSATNSGIGNNVVVYQSQVGSVNPGLVAQKAFENAFNNFKTKYNLS